MVTWGRGVIRALGQGILAQVAANGLFARDSVKGSDSDLRLRGWYKGQVKRREKANGQRPGKPSYYNRTRPRERV